MIKLSDILKQPEGRKLEFKETLPANAGLIKTILAFANDAGGELYIEKGLRLIARELQNYPEIALEWKEPGIAFRVTFVKKNFVPSEADEIYTDLPRRQAGASEKTSEKTSEKILELISKNRIITIKELSESIGVSKRSIERNIKKLQDENKLKRIGGDRGGHWEIIK